MNILNKYPFIYLKINKWIFIKDIARILQNEKIPFFNFLYLHIFFLNVAIFEIYELPTIKI